MKKNIVLIVCVLINLTSVKAQVVDTIIKELPSYISVLTTWGNRPEWGINSHDLYFLEKPVGDVFKINIVTKQITPVTANFYMGSIFRFFCLANGDFLICGNREFNSDDPFKQRHRLEMWVLDKDLNKQPVSLNEFCDEGSAVSRKNMTIAWTEPGQRRIFIGDITYKEGVPVIENKKLIISYDDSAQNIRLETQNFRPPNDEELIYTHYHGTNEEPFYCSETYGYNLKTGKYTNYTKDGHYNEAEGIFPDGKHLLIESDRHFDVRQWKIDLYKLTLDGNGHTERLTWFSSKYPGSIADNPVVSDDGKYFAFQFGIPKMGSGAGKGILIFDIGQYQKNK